MSRTQESIVELPLGLIERGFFQPREYFSPEAMEATKRSIQEKGQKYPVIVRPILADNPLFDVSWIETHYELADGERRFRCCKELGFGSIKALVRGLGDEEMLDHTLTTNDSLPLNPIEKATVFSRLAKEFGKSQSDIAKSFNLKQQQVSEYMRLLDLPKEIQDLTARAVISVRHARELLKIQDQEQMTALAADVKSMALSTRELTKIIKNDKKLEKIDKKTTFDVISEDKSFINLQKKPIDAALNRINSVINNEIGHLSWLERVHKALIPKKTHKKMEQWLILSLGSPLKPETWLVRVEFSLLVGVLLSVGALWLPIQALVALLGAIAAVLAYLYVTA